MPFNRVEAAEVMQAHQPERTAHFIEFRDYLKVLRRRKRLLLGTVCVAVVVASAYSFTRAPVYESLASVIIHPVLTDLANPSTRPGQIVSLQTEQQVLHSPAVEKRVLARVPAPGAYELHVTGRSGTLILDVTVSDRDPTKAQALAQAFAEEYLGQREELARQRLNKLSGDVSKQIDEQQAALGNIQRAVAAAPPGSADAAAATGQRDLVMARIGGLQERLNAVASLSVDPGEIIGAAAPPPGRAGPQHLLNIGIGLVIGLLAGISLAFVRDRLDDRISDDADERELGLPVLVRLPRGTEQSDSAAPVTLEQPEGLQAESLRRLRAKLVTLMEGEALSFAVTGATPDDEKSAMAVNLAVTLAQGGVEVLLVSANLRMPDGYRLLGVSNERGLTQLLDGTLAVDDVVQEVPGVPGLRVITSGPPPSSPPGELLQSSALNRLITGHGPRRDVLLFDAAPVTVFADSLKLVGLVDGVILTVRARSTRRGALVEAIAQLRDARARILGAVVVDARVDGGRAVELHRWSAYRRPQTPKQVTETAAPTNTG